MLQGAGEKEANALTASRDSKKIERLDKKAEAKATAKTIADNKNNDDNPALSN